MWMIFLCRVTKKAPASPSEAAREGSGNPAHGKAKVRRPGYPQAGKSRLPSAAPLPFVAAKYLKENHFLLISI
ncbi:hypothetical protein ACLUTX_03830 [Enterobacterales bacterium AE_CKDN230030158-1A_HGKHYDSX7]